jgi:hypothetical protein
MLLDPRWTAAPRGLPGRPWETAPAAGSARITTPLPQGDCFLPSEEIGTLEPLDTMALAPPAAERPWDRRLLTAPCWDRIRVRPVVTDSRIVREAQRHLGRPYAWGGTDLSRGVDCSGFTWSVYRRCGSHVPLRWFRSDAVDPRVHPERLERDGMVRVRVPRPGDVVVFGRQHVGIYIGAVNGQALYVSANHGGRRRPGRVDIMPVRSVGIRPVYYREGLKDRRRRDRRSRGSARRPAVR